MAEAWPTLGWTGDEKVAVRVSPTGDVQIFDGAFPAGNEPAAKPGLPGVHSVFVSPGGAPHWFVTFTPRTKSRPAAIAAWVNPNFSAPVASKSLQADGCRAQFAPDGSAVLVELSTSSSEASYYGDSRLFLLSRDGKLNLAVPPPKEGPVHDFAWNPNSSSFIAIVGRSPPVAMQYNRAGEAAFSFGAAAVNTVSFSPHGRFVALGGFGNMSGALTVWDTNKCKPTGATVQAPCTVSISWSPCSRFLLTATTRPRLQVDNGFRVWSYRGTLVTEHRIDPLFQAEWQPAPAGLYPDRPQSPLPKGASAAVAATSSDPAGGAGAASSGASSPAAPAAKPAGVYRPPRSTGLVSAMMADRYAATAGKVTPTGAPVVAVSSGSAVCDAIRLANVHAKRCNGMFNF